MVCMKLLTCESFITLVVLEWSFPSVRPHVLQQITRSSSISRYSKKWTGQKEKRSLSAWKKMNQCWHEFINPDSVLCARISGGGETRELKLRFRPCAL